MARPRLGFTKINVNVSPKMIEGYDALARRRATTRTELMRQVLMRGLKAELIKEKKQTTQGYE